MSTSVVHSLREPPHIQKMSSREGALDAQRAYYDRHNASIRSRFSEAVKEVLIDKPEDPIPFIAHRLLGMEQPENPVQNRGTIGGLYNEVCLDERYHLKYFGAPGPRVETTRVLMALGGIKWKPTSWNNGVPAINEETGAKMATGSWGALDTHITPGSGEWTESRYHIRTSAIQDAKATGEFDANMGRMPILVVNGSLEIGQNGAIERYLGRRLGLLGSDIVQAARIDMIAENVLDIKATLQMSNNKLADNPGQPQMMEWLEKLLCKEQMGCAVGNQLSLADAHLFCMCKGSRWPYKQSPPPDHLAMLEKCPNIASCVKAVEEHPGVAMYLTTRRAEWDW